MALFSYRKSGRPQIYCQGPFERFVSPAEEDQRAQAATTVNCNHIPGTGNQPEASGLVEMIARDVQ
jgi:hypothetical protein